MATLAASNKDHSDRNSIHSVVDFSGSMSEYATVTSQSKRIKLFKYLMSNMLTINHAEKVESKLLEGVSEDRVYKNKPRGDKSIWAACGIMHKEAELTDEEHSKADGSDDENKYLSTFERYLLKRNARQKEIKKAKKLTATKQTDKSSYYNNIPDELKNDPFIIQEVELRRNEKLRREQQEREQKDHEWAKQEMERIQREKDLALIMLNDGDSEHRHFDMRELVKQTKEDAFSGKKKTKIHRWKHQKLAAKAKRLAQKGVHVPAYEAESIVSRVTAAAPVTAKMVVEDDRFAAIFKDHRANLDPSHPEFIKNRTPFMFSLIKELQDRSIGSSKRPAEGTLDR